MGWGGKEPGALRDGTRTQRSERRTLRRVSDVKLQITVIPCAGRERGLTVLLLILRRPVRIEVIG